MNDRLGWILLIAMVAFYFYREHKPAPDGSPSVSEIRATGVSRGDAQLLSRMILEMGDMVVEDGQREKPYIVNNRSLKNRIRTMGDWTLGTNEPSISQRYPGLPEVMAGYFDDENKELNRQDFKQRCELLSSSLKGI